MIWPLFIDQTRNLKRRQRGRGQLILQNRPDKYGEFGSLAPNGFQSSIISLTRHLPDNWFGRRSAILLRKLVLGFLGRPLDMTVFGQNMRLYPFANVCERRVLFTPQFFDARERAAIAERLEPGYVFVDIGANVGAYSLFVAGALSGGARVFAFEPQPSVYERLTANIRFNPGSNIKAINCAIADLDGQISLFLNADNQGEASVKFMNWSGGEGASVNVQAKSLASVAAEEGLDRIDGLKLDVEGAEDLILVAFFRDAPKRLWPKLLIVENAPDLWQTDCRELCRDIGYKLIATTRMNLIFELI